MTENETNMSIKHAVCVLEAIGNGLTLSNKNDREDACVFAIQALEEIQQYRAIGTVEEIIHSNAKALVEQVELEKYKAIGTIEEFKALKEKSTPKKGIPYTSSNNHKFVECPSCHKDMDLYYDFCQHCGQSVDWGKTKT